MKCVKCSRELSEQRNHFEASNGTFCIISRYNFQFCWSSALFSISSLDDRSRVEFKNLELPRKNNTQHTVENYRESRLKLRRKKITFTSTVHCVPLCRKKEFSGRRKVRGNSMKFPEASGIFEMNLSHEPKIASV
jgi:hypothetical protein